MLTHNAAHVAVALSHAQMKKARRSGPEGGKGPDQPCMRTTSGTISSATMLMILISGFTAGPAVSL